MSKQQQTDVLEASQQKVIELTNENRQLEKQVARLEERIKELEKENGVYHRRAYSARIVLHELLDMALFEKGTSTKY